MAWDLSTDPASQEKLDWADTFVREEVEPSARMWMDLPAMGIVDGPTDVHQVTIAEALALPVGNL